MGEAYRQGRAARAELIGELTSEMQQADNGAPPPNSFPAQAARLAQGRSRCIGLNAVLYYRRE